MDADEIEALEIELLLEGLARRHGYDFRRYTPAHLRRQIRSVLLQERLKTVSQLQDRLLHHPEWLPRFVARLSIGVTGMFRDPYFYRRIREEVVPLLRTYPFVRIWVAGCSTGEEAYSLAIVLAEEGLLGRARLYGTDLSDVVLARARRGVVPLTSMRAYTEAYQAAGGGEDFSRYYVADHRNARLVAELRESVVFFQHNLVSDDVFNEFQLVLCRNVMIYFERPLRDRVHDLLHRSLVPFGVLGLGMRESIDFTPLASEYGPLAPRARLYRRRS
ncbi:MAG: protein-glutamate O-methyltransferase CheR [Deltaproteobacteria bacterium]|nr:protein-glutamate O-methyltransferase CheR [Deltaproteobacteria bacterium]